MADHLTAADLAHFLRSRKSADCRIAADWVEDHLDHPDVAWCVDRLEELARAAGLEVRYAYLHGFAENLSASSTWHSAGLAFDLGSRPDDCLLPVLAVLTGQSGRFQPAAAYPPAWEWLLKESGSLFLASRLPSWAAACVRRLKRAHSLAGTS